MIPLALIAGAVAGVVGFGLAWQLQAGNITQMELDHANTRITLQRAARQSAERYATQVSAAQANTATRVVDMRRDARTATDELGRLREHSAATLRAATEDAAACLADAIAKTELLNQCAGRYAGLAATADGHVSDIKTLTESWPN